MKGHRMVAEEPLAPVKIAERWRTMEHELKYVFPREEMEEKSAEWEKKRQCGCCKTGILTISKYALVHWLLS